MADYVIRATAAEGQIRAFAATTVCFVLSALMMALSMALEGKKVHYDQ